MAVGNKSSPPELRGRSIFGGALEADLAKARRLFPEFRSSGKRATATTADIASQFLDRRREVSRR